MATKIKISKSKRNTSKSNVNSDNVNKINKKNSLLEAKNRTKMLELEDRKIKLLESQLLRFEAQEKRLAIIEAKEKRKEFWNTKSLNTGFNSYRENIVPDEMKPTENVLRNSAISSLAGGGAGFGIVMQKLGLDPTGWAINRVNKFIDDRRKRKASSDNKNNSLKTEKSNDNSDSDKQESNPSDVKSSTQADKSILVEKLDKIIKLLGGKKENKKEEEKQKKEKPEWLQKAIKSLLGAGIGLLAVTLGDKLIDKGIKSLLGDTFSDETTAVLTPMIKKALQFGAIGFAAGVGMPFGQRIAYSLGVAGLGALYGGLDFVTGKLGKYLGDEGTGEAINDVFKHTIIGAAIGGRFGMRGALWGALVGAGFSTIKQLVHKFTNPPTEEEKKAEVEKANKVTTESSEVLSSFKTGEKSLDDLKKARDELNNVDGTRLGRVFVGGRRGNARRDAADQKRKIEAEIDRIENTEKLKKLAETNPNAASFAAAKMNIDLSTVFTPETAEQKQIQQVINTPVQVQSSADKTLDTSIQQSVSDNSSNNNNQTPVVFNIKQGSAYNSKVGGNAGMRIMG